MGMVNERIYKLLLSCSVSHFSGEGPQKTRRTAEKGNIENIALPLPASFQEKLKEYSNFDIS